MVKLFKISPCDITGIPARTRIRVSDRKGRSEGSRGLWWAESAERGRGEQGADGLYCRGDSELSPDWEEP